MRYWDDTPRNPAKAERQEQRRRATGAADIAVRAAAYSGVRPARAERPVSSDAQARMEIPRQRDDADSPQDNDRRP